jgi:hypothetical protein
MPNKQYLRWVKLLSLSDIILCVCSWLEAILDDIFNLVSAMNYRYQIPLLLILLELCDFVSPSVCPTTCTSWLILPPLVLKFFHHYWLDPNVETALIFPHGAITMLGLMVYVMFPIFIAIKGPNFNIRPWLTRFVKCVNWVLTSELTTSLSIMVSNKHLDLLLYFASNLMLELQNCLKDIKACSELIILSEIFPA